MSTSSAPRPPSSNTAEAARPRRSLLARLAPRGRRALRSSIRRWTRKRHGIDPDPFTLPGTRVYILPTALGVTYGAMVFAMFLGAMNYGNNLALALCFILGGLGLTAMHHSHRNLAGIKIRAAGSEPVFAGQTARFRIAIENPSALARYEITLANDNGTAPAQRIEPGGRIVLDVAVPAHTRGYLQLPYFEVATRHPFGLFRAWSVLHMNMRTIAYPRPSERTSPPPLTATDTGGAQDMARDAEDFAGLRSFHPGDSPARIAWKAYAREQGLQVKLFAGTSVTSHLFDWDSLPGLPVEARLSQLCRWIEDAHAAGRAFGLKLPTVTLPVNVGAAHRQRCLTALALFDSDERGTEA